MNVIDEGKKKGSSKDVNDNETGFEFYGGLVYKQNENKSLYHYQNTSGARVTGGGVMDGQLDQLRLIRDKCINLYKKYTSKY